MASVRDRLKKGGAKGLPRSLDGLIDAIDEEIAAAGGGRSYALISMSAGQNGVSSVETINFDTLVADSGDITIPVTGTIRLPADKVFLLVCGLDMDHIASSGVLRYMWRDVGVGLIGLVAESFPYTTTGNNSRRGLALAPINTTGGTKDVQLEVIASASTANIRSSGVGTSVGDSFALVLELG